MCAVVWLASVCGCVWVCVVLNKCLCVLFVDYCVMLSGLFVSDVLCFVGLMCVLVVRVCVRLYGVLACVCCCCVL